MNPGAVNMEYHRRDLGWRARAGSVHPEKEDEMKMQIHGQ
jgi:hypothetical protein